MKRYLLFAWDQYYPMGGFNDFVNDFETEEEALERWNMLSESRDYGMIVDINTGKQNHLYARA